MTKNVFIGVNNTAKKLKNIYIGVNNTPKKVKAAYVGVNGIARKVWPNNLIPDDRYQSLSYLGISGSGFNLVVNEGIFGYDTRVYMKFKLLSSYYEGARSSSGYVTSYLFTVANTNWGRGSVNGYYDGSSSLNTFDFSAQILDSNMRFLFEDVVNPWGCDNAFYSTESEEFITNDIYTLDFNNNKKVYLYNNTGYYSIASHNLVGTFIPLHSSFDPAWNHSSASMYTDQKKFNIPIIDRILYSLKIYKSGTLTKDYIPCYRVSDKYVGIYDLVNRVAVLSDSVKLTTANVLYAE